MLRRRFDGRQRLVIDFGKIIETDAEGFRRQIDMVESFGVFDERGITVVFNVGENLCDAFVDLRIEGGTFDQRFQLFLEIWRVLEYDAHISNSGRRFRRPYDVTIYLISLI